MLTFDTPVRSAAYRYGGTALFLAAAVILTALGFEYLAGYAPCPLCLAFPHFSSPWRSSQRCRVWPA